MEGTSYMADAPDEGPITFHVVPCTLDGLRVPRGRGVDATKQEFCKGFIRKKYVAIERDGMGQLEGTLPGGFKAKEVVELDRQEQMGIQMAITVCMRCSHKDVEHKQLRWTVHGLQGEERYRCKSCSYCTTFIRVDLEDNSLCEDCGCEASLHQKTVAEPIPRPPKATKTLPGVAAESAVGSSAAGASAEGSTRLNATYKPGQRYKVVGTIMRAGESLDSEKISRLNAGTVVQVLEIGAGPTGKRLRVRTEDNQEGWISVVSDAGVTLLKPLAPARKKAAAAKAPGAAAAAAKAATSTPWGPAVQPQPRGGGDEAEEGEAANQRSDGGLPVEGSIGSFLGSWAGGFEREEEEEEEQGVSISQLLSGGLGDDFELLAEEEAAKRPTEPAAAEQADAPDDLDEPHIESLAEILARLGEEEVAEQDGPTEAGAAPRRQRDEDAASSSSSCREGEGGEAGGGGQEAEEERGLREAMERAREQHAEKMRKRLEERKAARKSPASQEQVQEGEEERKHQEGELARRRREQEDEELAALKRAEEEALKRAEEEEAALKRAEEELAALKRAEEEEEARRKAAEEEEARRKVEEEEEAALKRAEEELAALKRAEEEEAALKRAEEELAALKRAEEEEEALRRAEEEEEAALKRAAEELAALKKAEEEEALRRAEEEEAALKRAEEELAAVKRAEEEEALRRAEEEEAALKRAEEELAALKRAEEEEALRLAEEEEAALRKAEEELAALKRAEEEEALRRAEEEEVAMRRAREEEEDVKRAEEEVAAKRTEEEAASRRAEAEAKSGPFGDEGEDSTRMEEEVHFADAPEESPLACAARRKDLFQVQALLRDKANPNETNAVGETPLLEAAASGDLNVVALLLGYAADPSKRAPPGVTDLDSGLSPEVRMLFHMFEEKVQAKKVDSEPKRHLLQSLDPGSLAQVRNMLRLGMRALAPSENKLSPAACMASSGTVREFPDTENHRVALHMADPVRPVLVLSPLWQPVTATVVMLHGLFQSGQMWERLARDLSRNLPHVRFLAPTAPTQGCLWGFGPGWHGGDSGDIGRHLEETSEEVAELLRQQPAAAARPDRVVLLGFSMGGTLASLAALKAAEPYAGLVIFGTTGLYPDYFGDNFPAWTGAAGLEVLQCHGGSDRMVSQEEARQGAERLRRAGCHVHFSLAHDVGHTISSSMVSEARAWLAKRLPDGASPKSDGADEAKSPLSRKTSGWEPGGSPEKSAQVFAMDEDDEASNNGDDEYDDLDAVFGFETPPKVRKTPEEAKADDGEAEKGGADDDLDAMYDFTAVNNAALASKAAEAAAAEPAAATANPAAAAGDTGKLAEDMDDRSKPRAEEEDDWELAEAEENVVEGDGQEVEVLLEHAESEDTSSVTVASTASMWNVKEAVAAKFGLGHTSVVRLLRRKGRFGTVLEGYSNDTPLGRRRRLLLLGVDLRPEAVASATGKGATSLAAAARRGDVEEVKSLLRLRAEPNERDAAGETPLFAAARGGHADAVAVLLLGKADPAMRSENGLVAADLLPGPPVGALLWLALGAEVSAREQREAFEALEECTRFLVARLLEQRGVRPAVRDVLSEAEWVAACA